MSYLEYNVQSTPTGPRKILYLNWPLALLLCTVACVGFLQLYSVAGGSLYPWAEPQMKRFALGLTAMMMVAMVPIWFWRNMSVVAYLLSVILLIGVELFGAVGMGAQRWIDRVGLGGFENHFPAQLSGGMQQRLAIAQSLIMRPRVLLLDEPFAALGPALKREMLDLVRALTDETGATLLMVSHDPDDARRLADEVILVADGRAHPPEPTGELLDNPPAALRDYLG